jgi:membrane protein
MAKPADSRREDVPLDEVKDGEGGRDEGGRLSRDGHTGPSGAGATSASEAGKGGDERGDASTADRTKGDPGGGPVPDSPTDLPKEAWMATAKRAFKEFKEDNCTDWAAALTYYAVLALFPALIVLLSLLGLLGQEPQTSNALLDIVGSLGPDSAVQTFEGPIRDIVSQQKTAGIAFVIGLLGALWSASGYMGAFFRASDAVWDVKEGRPAWKLIPLRVLVTLVTVLAIALVLIALVISGPVAEAVGDVIGLGSTAVTVWQIVKWPVMLLIVMMIVAALFHIAPNVKHPKITWVSPGGVIAVVTWIVVSVLFALYVSKFGSYQKTYGALAGVIVLLLWLYLTNLALLFGAEFNAETERARQIRKGVPPEQEPFLPPRDPADDDDVEPSLGKS